jgi:hypothetical protein
MSYTQVTGMSSTRFPLKGLGCCGQPVSGMGQESGPARGSALGAAVAVAVLGGIVYLTLKNPSAWTYGPSYGWGGYYGGGGYYDHRLGKWVSRNRRRGRRVSRNVRQPLRAWLDVGDPVPQDGHGYYQRLASGKIVWVEPSPRKRVLQKPRKGASKRRASKRQR